MKLTSSVKTDNVVIANVANGDLGNAITTYYYFDLGRNGFTNFSLQYVITATTLTLEMTNERENVTDASAIWTDVSTALLGAATITASGAVIPANRMAIGRFRVKAVTSNATNALRLTLARSN